DTLSLHAALPILSVLKYGYEVVIFLLISAGLALLVWRSRGLVAERAEAERARGNLARYFSPKVADALAGWRGLGAAGPGAERARDNLPRSFSPRVVDELAGRDEPLGRVRRQTVGVLF